MSHVECHNCGSQVTKRFARVFGDNSDTVRGCLNCSAFGQVADGAGAMGDDHHGRDIPHPESR